jgi:hypothetical protein
MSLEQNQHVHAFCKGLYLPIQLETHGLYCLLFRGADLEQNGGLHTLDTLASNANRV